MAGFISTKDEVETASPRVTDDGDHDTFSHYITKEAMEAAMFNGIPAIALCGKVWLPTKDATRYPVCPECKEIWEGLPAE